MGSRFTTVSVRGWAYRHGEEGPEAVKLFGTKNHPIFDKPFFKPLDSGFFGTFRIKLKAKITRAEKN